MFPRSSKYLPDGWRFSRDVHSPEQLRSLHINDVMVAYELDQTTRQSPYDPPRFIHITATEHTDMIAAALNRARDLERAEFLAGCDARDAEAAQQRKRHAADANAAVSEWLAKQKRAE